MKNESNLNIIGIASKCGLNNTSNFNKRFKKVKYLKEDLNKTIGDKKVFEVVGHTDFLDTAKTDLQKIKHSN